MDPKCRAAVRAAAGDRKVSDGKIAQIEAAINSKASELARRDVDRWRTLSTEQRTMEAAAAAMDDVRAAADRKEMFGAMQVTSTARTTDRIEAAMKLNDLTRSQGFIRDMEHTNNAIAQIRAEGLGALRQLVDAAETKDGTGVLRNLGMRFFGLDNPEMTADVVREIFKNADGATGNRAATAAARAWLDTIEGLRTRFNAAGGDVGKLWYGYIAQAHDAHKIFEAGAEKWADAALPLLDRRQYLNADGSSMSSDQVRAMLTEAWKTITTGGDNKTEPGQFKTVGARANRGSDHRVLHFADGDAWMAYMRQFGEGSLYDSIVGHVGKMARDIGLVEAYGPNPAQQFRLQADIARRADETGGLKDLLRARAAGNTPQGYWNVLSGASGMPENRAVAQVNATLRNVHTASKIIWGPMTGFADVATILHTLQFNRLPYFEMLQNVGRQFDKQTRRTLESHGIIAESLSSSINRWIADNLTHDWSGRVANAVMKASFMNAWTDGLRNAFAQTMMGGLARAAKKDWGALTEWDRYLLERKGITEADWQIVRQATPDRIGNYEVLTPNSIRATGAEGAEQVATKVLGSVIDESQFAVVNPDLATRAIATAGGLPAGTFRGELLRHFAQFKSFPITMLTRHWRRIGEMPAGLDGAPLGFQGESTGAAAANRIVWAAALMVTTTTLGGIQNQVRDLLTGKDPVDPTGDHWVKFWTKAVASGGGAGSIADVVLADPSSGGIGTWQKVMSVAGPAGGSLGGLLDVTLGNAQKAAQGKQTHAGAEALRFASSHLPGTWQGRLLFNNLFLYHAQEALNPGYLGRMQQRAQKEFGQEYWWTPGEWTPNRAPDIGLAVGIEGKH